MRRWLARSMIGIALVACGAYALWWLFNHPEFGVPMTTVAPPAPRVADVPTVMVPVAKVRALAPRAKTRLRLPGAVQADPGQHVLAATRVEPDPTPHTISTVLDAATGEVTTYDQVEPLPWLTLQPRGEIALHYGLRDGAPMARVTLRQDLLQIKTVHVGGMATLDQDGRWYAGVGLAWRW